MLIPRSYEEFKQSNKKMEANSFSCMLNQSSKVFIDSTLKKLKTTKSKQLKLLKSTNSTSKSHSPSQYKLPLAGIQNITSANDNCSILNSQIVKRTDCSIDSRPHFNKVSQLRRNNLNKKKIEKQQTKGRWSNAERSRYIQAVSMFGKNSWPMVEEFMGTRTLKQIIKYSEKEEIKTQSQKSKLVLCLKYIDEEQSNQNKFQNQALKDSLFPSGFDFTDRIQAQLDLQKYNEKENQNLEDQISEFITMTLQFEELYKAQTYSESDPLNLESIRNQIVELKSVVRKLIEKNTIKKREEKFNRKHQGSVTFVYPRARLYQVLYNDLFHKLEVNSIDELRIKFGRLGQWINRPISILNEQKQLDELKITQINELHSEVEHFDCLHDESTISQVNVLNEFCIGESTGSSSNQQEVNNVTIKIPINGIFDHFDATSTSFSQTCELDNIDDSFEKQINQNLFKSQSNNANCIEQVNYFKIKSEKVSRKKQNELSEIAPSI